MLKDSYLSKYIFDWELFEVVVGGKSSLDARTFMSPIQNREDAFDFLENYGFDQNDPILKAELFGIFQEALQFIRRYFIGAEGLPDLQIPPSLFVITEISDLFLLANNHLPGKNLEEALWAGVVLKVMHTILHADKDLRGHYFNTIQQQIFDKFYKFIHRSQDGELKLSSPEEEILLQDFQTKSRKSRDSIIIKLLHKAENIAEELFDRIGVRIVTQNKFDGIRVIRFLQRNHLIIAHNIKPSRSINSMIDIEQFKQKHRQILKDAIKEKMSDEICYKKLVALAEKCKKGIREEPGGNPHSSRSYSAIHFTARQLIVHRNPFVNDFKEAKKLAKEYPESDILANKILALDIGSFAKETRFFFPFEVQIVDSESHRLNTEGEASHADYKKSQIKTAFFRLFKSILEYKGINTPAL